ncbi:TPA: hypothetical protein ACKQCR_000078 [Serratia marcescens]
MDIKKIQGKWERGQLIGVDLIASKNNAEREINIYSEESDGFKNTFNKECGISYGSVTSLSSLIKKRDDLWSGIQINNKVLLSDGDVLFCGEGEMGSDGFIVRADKYNKLKWFMYSTTSNPFFDVIRLNGWLHIKSTLGFYLDFGIADNDICMRNK